MRWNSVRVRLTLWHVAVLAAVLGCFGVALSYTVRASLAAAVDRELSERAHGFSRRWEEAGEMGRTAMGLTPEAPIATPQGPAASDFPAPSPPSSEVERRGYFRRPRILDWEGHPKVPFSGDEPWDADSFLVSLAGKEIYSDITVDRERVRVFSMPLEGAEGVEGVIQVAHPLEEQQRLNEGLIRTLLTLIPIALLVAGVGGAFLTDRALRPVRRITQAAAQIGAEDLSQRLEVTGKDELSELASTFNGMINRLEESFQKLESAYEQQRRFTGDASHELRTPLTAIKANTSFALSGEHSPEVYREALQEADEAADTMTRIVQDLLLLARSDSGQLKLDLAPTELGSLLNRAAATFRDRPGAAIEVITPETSAGVLADSHHLRRLFTNLLENARRHTPEEGRIEVRVEEQGEETRVRVSDTGEGIAAEHLPHLCDRFYRVDSARARSQGGTGLGLAICRSIVQAHGGQMEIESQVGIGTTVTITLQKADLPEDAGLTLIGA